MLCRIKQYSSFEIIENKNKVKPYFYRKIKPHFSCLEPYFFKQKLGQKSNKNKVYKNKNEVKPYLSLIQSKKNIFCNSYIITYKLVNTEMYFNKKLLGEKIC